MMGKIQTCLIGLILCSSAITAAAEEIRPGVFRSPDERFENLKDYPFSPHYLEVEFPINNRSRLRTSE